MPHNFFISHFSGDREIAELFSNALRRITLEQINPWYSSDTAGGGGLRPGGFWFDQIFSRINQSKAVVSLLTPNSVNRPWIYFESGIGQALEDCEVIPVCIGLDRGEILPPLGLYQCYQLNDYRSVVEFFSKLLTLFKIKFDEEMARGVIEQLVSRLSQIPFQKVEVKKEENETIELLMENFKNHIDKRFIELLESPTYTIKDDGVNVKIANSATQTSIKGETGYTLQFRVNFPGYNNDKLFIDIRPGDTFQTLSNSLYFMIMDHVEPYSYLEEWVIVEQKTHRHVIIREVAEFIPAASIFLPNTKWEILKLKKPYRATDSSDRIRG